MNRRRVKIGDQIKCDFCSQVFTVKLSAYCSEAHDKYFCTEACLKKFETDAKDNTPDRNHCRNCGRSLESVIYYNNEIDSVFCGQGCNDMFMAGKSILSLHLERDPDGKLPHESGAKLDSGKLKVGLVLNGFARALTEVCRVGTYGAEKYSPDGWKKVNNAVERYTDALYRHLLEEAKGNAMDESSGLYHAAQTAWNALARLEKILEEENKQIVYSDDGKCMHCGKPRHYGTRMGML